MLLKGLSLSKVRQQLESLTFNSSSAGGGKAFYTLYDSYGDRLFTHWINAGIEQVVTAS